MERVRSYVEDKGAKVLYSFFIIQMGIFVASSIVCMVSQPKNTGETLRQNIFKWAVLYELYIVQMYYSYHAVLKQNVLELFACVIISLCTTFCGGYRFIVIFMDNYNLGSNIMALVQVTTSIMLQIFFLIAAYFLWDIFKWRIFKKIGGNSEVQKLVKTYEKYKALVKLFCILCLTLFATFLIFVINPSAVHIVIDVLLILFTVLIFFLGYKGVRQENNGLMIGFYVLFSILWSFTIFAFVVIYLQPKWLKVEISKLDVSSKAILICIIAAYNIICILTLIYSILAQKGFNKGLKEFLQSKKQQEQNTNKLLDTESEQE